MVSARPADNRPVLPPRPLCPRCYTQVAAVVLRAAFGTGGYVVVTDSCKHTRRGVKKQRCGMPYAVIAQPGHTVYLHAETWPELEARVEHYLRVAAPAA